MIRKKRILICPLCSADRIKLLADDTVLCINCCMEWPSSDEYERACTAKKMGGGRVVVGEDYLVGGRDGSLKQDLDKLVKVVANDTYQKMSCAIDASINARTQIIDSTDDEYEKSRCLIERDVLQNMKTWVLSSLESLDNE